MSPILNGTQLFFNQLQGGVGGVGVHIVLLPTEEHQLINYTVHHSSLETT